MALANLSLINTFTDMMTRVNQLVVGHNRLTEGIHFSTGNVTITNSDTASQYAANIDGTLKVTNIEVGPGSNVRPSITRYGSGNSNAGLWFPDTNTVAIGTSSVSRVHVASDGKIGIGNTSPGYLLDVNGTFHVSTTSWFTGNVGIGSGRSSPTVALDINGSIWGTGNITMESDATLKYNVDEIQNGLAIIKRLRGVRYNKHSDDARYVGFIAQEVEKILPEVVSKNGDLLGVNYPVITAVLVQAIKELSDEVTALKNQLMWTRSRDWDPPDDD